MSDGDLEDNGETTVKPEEAALIVSPYGEVTLLIPHYEDEEEVPRLVAALGVLAVKLQDQNFVEALLAELDDDDDDDDDEDLVDANQRN